jgi:hypothetical protein
LRCYRSRGETLPPASSRRGVRRVVPRHARPDGVPLAPGVNAGLNDIGVKVRKGPRRLAVRVPGRQQQARRGPVRSGRPPRMELCAIGDAHKVAIPRGLEIQTPKPDLESDREGVRAAHGVPLAPVLGADHHRDSCWETDLEREAP